MTKERIVNLWLKGYSKERLFKEQESDISLRDDVRGKKKKEIKYIAQSEVEQALLDWWRRQTKDEAD